MRSMTLRRTFYPTKFPSRLNISEVVGMKRLRREMYVCDCRYLISRWHLCWFSQIVHMSAVLATVLIQLTAQFVWRSLRAFVRVLSHAPQRQDVMGKRTVPNLATRKGSGPTSRPGRCTHLTSAVQKKIFRALSGIDLRFLCRA
jgi:hypothetical protein